MMKKTTMNQRWREIERWPWFSIMKKVATYINFFRSKTAQLIACNDFKNKNRIFIHREIEIDSHKIMKYRSNIGHWRLGLFFTLLVSHSTYILKIFIRRLIKINQKQSFKLSQLKTTTRNCNIYYILSKRSFNISILSFLLNLNKIV